MDSASASSSTGPKFQQETESQWFDTCPDFDNEVVVAALSDTSGIQQQKNRTAWNLVETVMRMSWLQYASSP